MINSQQTSSSSDLDTDRHKQALAAIDKANRAVTRALEQQTALKERIAAIESRIYRLLRYLDQLKEEPEGDDL